MKPENLELMSLMFTEHSDLFEGDLLGFALFSFLCAETQASSFDGRLSLGDMVKKTGLSKASIRVILNRLTEKRLISTSFSGRHGIKIKINGLFQSAKVPPNHRSNPYSMRKELIYADNGMDKSLVSLETTDITENLTSSTKLDIDYLDLDEPNSSFLQNNKINLPVDEPTEIDMFTPEIIDKTKSKFKSKSEVFSRGDYLLAEDWLDFANREKPWSQCPKSWTVENFSVYICKARKYGNLTEAGIREVFKFIKTHDFWRKNALSPRGLLNFSDKADMKKLDMILSQMKTKTFEVIQDINSWDKPTQEDLSNPWKKISKDKD